MTFAAHVLGILRRLRQDERGSVSAEFVIMMPILFWAFMASFVFFDGYRQSAVNLKAAYTVGDLISRETEAINDDYIDSMYTLLGLMTRTSSPIKMRISVARWDAGDNRFYLDWSKARGLDYLPLTNSDLLEMQDKLPEMPDNERVIIVETSNTFVPLYKVGLDNIDIDNLVFTRPRFGPQVVFAAN